MVPRIVRSSVNSFIQALQIAGQGPDLLDIGVIVCDGSQRLVAANQTAYAILHSADGLYLGIDGRISEVDDESHLLAKTLERVTEDASSHKTAKPPIVLSIQRSSGRPPLRVLVRAHKSEWAKISKPTALVVVLGYRVGSEHEFNVADYFTSQIYQALNTDDSGRSSPRQRLRTANGLSTPLGKRVTKVSGKTEKDSATRDASVCTQV